ncbi:ankyrin, partial [Melanomma pulvis-pyrius CBS 109.77]
LHIAAKRGNQEVVMTLVKEGAKVDMTLDKEDQTTLHIAAAQGHTEVVRVLIKNGADISTEDTRGRAPIEIAQEKGYDQVVNIL